MITTENYRKDSCALSMMQEIDCRDNPCTDFDWFQVAMEANNKLGYAAVFATLLAFVGDDSAPDIIWEQSFRDPKQAEAWADKVATAFGGRVLTFPDANFIRRHHGKV